jgi:hypothetical protein
VSCALAPASTVNAALGTAVGAPQSDVNGSVTVCTYKSISPPQSVIVRIDTGTDASAFVASKSQFVTQGETTTPVSGLGDQAFSSTLSAGSITNSTIVVLKGSASLLVTGSASLAQVEALATQLLPHI